MHALRRSRTLAVVVLTLTVAISFLLWSHAHNVSFAKHVEAVTPAIVQDQTASVEKMKIVPADVLGGPQWAPLTGDGSN
jgi:hypothetical protein